MKQALNKLVITAACIVATSAFVVGCNEKKESKQKSLVELEKQTETTLGMRQDEVEQVLLNFVTMLYAPTSDSDYEKALDEIKEITTDEEYNNIKSQIVSGRHGNEVLESQVYYIAQGKSSDGREREMVDLKISDGNSNKMYLLEFIIRGGKIEDHKVWTY